MHRTAFNSARQFFANYVPADVPSRVVEIGSQDVSGSLRSLCPGVAEYVGVDVAPGAGVDLVLDDPYQLPFADSSVDFVVSSSCFEHSEFFWVLFDEILRALRPAGIFCLNAPATGPVHRFPVDCWRFYPDAGEALVNWSRRRGGRTTLLESYTSELEGDVWTDYVAVFLKDEQHAALHPRRIRRVPGAQREGQVPSRSPLFLHRSHRRACVRELAGCRHVGELAE